MRASGRAVGEEDVSEMVERVARWYMPAAWEQETKWALEWRKKSLSRAREVLALMREPTDTMVAAGEREVSSWDSRFDSAKTIFSCAWDSAIDEALR